MLMEHPISKVQELVWFSSGDILEIALRFLFKAYNNESEYEVILMELKIGKGLGASQMVVYNDSSVVVG